MSAVNLNQNIKIKKKVLNSNNPVWGRVEVNSAKWKNAKQSMKGAMIEFKLYGVSEEKKILPFDWGDLRWLHERHGILCEP